MAQLLSIGYSQRLTQNVIYALPGKLCTLYADSGTFEQSSDGTNFTSLTLTNQQAVVAGGYLRSTAAGTPDINLQALSATGTGSATASNTVLSSSATGTQNNWAPGIIGTTMILWSGASDLTVTGFSGGIRSQLVTLINTGSAVAYFSHQSASSTAGNKLQN